MQSDENNFRLPMKKKKSVFFGSSVLGTGNKIVDANIIAFEHALEKIQNKLSLPEYTGPENYTAMERNENEFHENFNYDIKIKYEEAPSFKYNRENVDKNELVQKQNNIIAECGKENLWDNVNYINYTNKLVQQKPCQKSHTVMKQMTLDKYSFDTCLTDRYTKSSNSLIFSSSTCAFVDSKNCIYQNILYMGNNTSLEAMKDTCSLSIRNMNVDDLSHWRRQNVQQYIRSDQLSLEGTKETRRNAASCIRNDEGVVSDNLCCYDDYLDMDIDRAIWKYEVDKLQNISHKETGVQTMPIQVHPCNCLGYHMCTEFRNTPNRGCAKNRYILALDLDTLNRVSRKRHAGASMDCEFDTKKRIVHEVSEQYVPEMKESPNAISPTNKMTSSGDLIEFFQTRVHSKEQMNKHRSPDIVAYNEDHELYVKASDMSSSVSTSSSSCQPAQDVRNLHCLLPHEQLGIPLEKDDFSVDLKATCSNQKDCVPSIKQMDEVPCKQVLEDNGILQETDTHCFAQRREIGSLASACVYEDENRNRQDIIATELISSELLQETDQSVPDGAAYSAAVNVLPDDGLRSSPSFLWRELPSIQDFSVRTPFEKFLDLKPVPQKPRRIGLSRRDKTISLHPKRN